MILEELLGRYGPELERELKGAVGVSLLPLYHMVRYHLGWVDQEGRPAKAGGKSLRPLLCLLSCEGVGGHWRSALPAAAAVELLHNFSLVHDDIQDRSPVRRRRPTVWSVWGEAQAINAGDALYAMAQMSLQRLAEQGVAPGRVLEALSLLTQAALNLCEGQQLDLAYQGRWDLTTDDYLRMIGLKTASLFRGAAALGALIGSGQQETVERLGRFGFHLGMAFQMRDDFLGIWGRAEAMGKEPRDLQERKRTLPLILGLQTGHGLAQALQGLLGSDSPEAETEARNLLEAAGVHNLVQELARCQAREALGALTGLSLTDGERLGEMAAFAAERTF